MIDEKILNESDIEDVDGGRVNSSYFAKAKLTKMKCNECGYSELKVGNYLGKSLECPVCHKNTLVGIE